MSAQVETVRVLHRPDPDPDLSYLELERTDAPEDRATKQARMAAYDRGDWGMIGVCVQATIVIPIEGREVTETVTSPGLWQIESDSDDGYLRSVAREEAETLRQMLRELCVQGAEDVTAEVVDTRKPVWTGW